MADFSALKTSIQNYIKQNGNEEITGNLLQQILLSMVSTLGDSAINDLVTALNAEIANRGNADTDLGGRITSEAEARAGADNTLRGLIDGITDNIENGYVYAGVATPSSTPASGKVFYLALTAGTYTNFGATVVPQGINILKYNGSAWSLDTFIGLDDAPTQGSNNLVKSGGVLDSIIKDGSAFDLSAYNSGATYADLSAALTALNALPAAYKKGGMSMKFVQSSDNKYVQWRLMSDSFNTTVANWQGVDDEPTAGSDNLVKSGGIYPVFAINSILECATKVFGKSIPVIDNNKINFTSNNNVDTFRFDVSKITMIIVSDAPFNESGPYYGITLTDESDNVLSHYNDTASLDSSALSGATYIYVTSRNKNASSYIPTKIVINGCPFTFDSFRNAFREELGLNKENNPTYNSSKIIPSNSIAKLTTGFVQDFVAAVGSTAGSNMAFLTSNLQQGKKIAFYLSCNNDVIKKYSVRGNSGADIQYEPNEVDLHGGHYRFEPNKLYVVPVSNDMVNQSFFGAYISVGNVIGNGNCQFRVWCDFWKQSDLHLYNLLENKYMLSGKTMWTLWDSLGVNTWQQYFAELTGALFDADLNIKADNPLSVGGTTSYPFDMDGGQARALHLGSYKNVKQIDYIFYENVNDGGMITYDGVYHPELAGTINDKPFMLSSYKTISPQTFASNAEARTWIENNWSTFLGYFSASEKKAGVIARIPITPSQGTPNGSKITFSGTVTTAGQISFDWFGNTYAVNVAVGDTLQDIVNKFLNYSFGAGCTDVDGGSGSLVIFYYQSGVSSAKITNFNGGSTGISATIIDAAGAADYCWAFKGETAAEFADISNWGNAMGLTLYSIYKGIVNYLQRTFPEVNLYWVLPFSLNPGSQSDTTYRDANGKLDMDKYKNSPAYKNRQNLFAIQKEVCEYYGVPYIDLFTQAGMGVNNLETYIPYNDVHPRAIGYKRYAEYIAKLMGIG